MDKTNSSWIHTHTCVHIHHALTRVHIHVCVCWSVFLAAYGFPFQCMCMSPSLLHTHTHTQHSHQLTHTISPKCTRTSMHAHTHTRVCKRSIACNENGRNSAHVSSSYSLPTLLIPILLLLLTMPCAQFAQFSALSYCASLSPACMQSPHPFHVPCSTSPRVPP